MRANASGDAVTTRPRGGGESGNGGGRRRGDAVAERVGVAFGDVRCGCDDVLFADVVVCVAGRERIALGRR